MTDPYDESFVNLNRRGALEEIENLKAVRATAWDEHTHIYRWLMASLLAINGAACIAVVDHGMIPVDYRLWACAAFIVGIMLALLVAVFGQHSVQKSLLPLQKHIGYWMTVADDGERDKVMEDALSKELKVSARIGFGSRIVAWISAIAFLSGALIAGFEIATAIPDGSASAIAADL